MSGLVLPPSSTAECERAFDDFAVNARRLATQVCRHIHDATHESELGTEQVLDLLREACAAAGSQKAFAASAGVSPQFLTDILRQRRNPGEAVLPRSTADALAKLGIGATGFSTLYGGDR